MIIYTFLSVASVLGTCLLCEEGKLITLVSFFTELDSET